MNDHPERCSCPRCTVDTTGIIAGARLAAHLALSGGREGAFVLDPSLIVGRPLGARETHEALGTLIERYSDFAHAHWPNPLAGLET